MLTQEIHTTQPGRIAQEGNSPAHFWRPTCLCFLAENKRADTKRGFRLNR